MNDFRSALVDCQLSDLGFTGAGFTWSNRRSDGYFTKEQLDRVVANNDGAPDSRSSRSRFWWHVLLTIACF